MPLTIHFQQPSCTQSAGGLDAAVQSLRAALITQGITVDDTLPKTAEPGHIVHFHGLWQPAHARAARQCGLPYVVSPHGMLEPWAWRHKWWKKWPYFQFIEKRHLACAGALLATGSREAARLKKFAPHQRIEAIPLGLTGDARPDYRAARQQLGWAAEEIVLLYLSRLHVKKGPDLLLRALVGMKWPVVTRLVFVGDGEPAYVESLKHFAGDHAGSLPRIDWPGAVWGADRWKYFQGADLFCLPTYSENFGLAVLDALQVGTPALVTGDTPWTDDLTPDRGYTGPRSLESLRALLTRFFATPRVTDTQRAEVSAWAWEKFDWKKLAPQYAAFYESVVQGSPTV